MSAARRSRARSASQPARVRPAPVSRREASITRQFDANGDYPVTATFTPEDPDRYAGKTILAEDYLTERLQEIRLL